MVPSSNSHLKNTAGGSYTAQRQGGTIIGLATATSIITKVEKTLQPSKSSFYLKMTKSYQNKIRDKSTLKHNPETKEPQKAKKLI